MRSNLSCGGRWRIGSRTALRAGSLEQAPGRGVYFEVVELRERQPGYPRRGEELWKQFPGDRATGTSASLPQSTPENTYEIDSPAQVLCRRTRRASSTLRSISATPLS